MICVSHTASVLLISSFGDNVVVSGTGSIGLAAIQILKAAGAQLKDHRSGHHLLQGPLIKSYGADFFINSRSGDLAGEVKKIFGTEVGADVWSMSVPVI